MTELSRLRAASLVLFAAVFCLALAGCAKPTIVGKWTGNVPIGGRALPGTLDLKSDNTMAMSLTAPMMGAINATGTYSSEGDNLTVTATSATIAGKSFQLPANMRTNTSPFKLDGDKMTLTQNGQSFELTRSK